MSEREFWIMTQIFVYLHGTDERKTDQEYLDESCPHCKFISDMFYGYGSDAIPWREKHG